MTYTIERHTEHLAPVVILQTNSRSRAQTIAQRAAEKGQGQVYVSWFRPSDGQQGYLNQDGDNPVGKPW